MDKKYKIVSPKDFGYPQNLLNVDVQLPQKLWIDGKILKRDSQAVAIVGSRSMTEYGRKVAYKFAYTLAKNNITIVSGLAKGIDTVAHTAALQAKGRTIAVLGNGLDMIYPAENKYLASKIINNGVIITEFEPEVKPLGNNFLQRNRLIAAMSKAVLIVEGRRRSGTLSIANHAANIGVDVFAIPGNIDSPLSALPNYLIESGAGVAREPQDILDML